MRLFRTIILCIGLCLFYQSHANQTSKEKGHLIYRIFKPQKYKPNLRLETRYYYGFLMNHHTELEPMQAHLSGFELSLAYNTFGKREWQKTHHYPYISYNLFYSPLTGHPSLGQTYAAYPSIDIPVYQTWKHYLSWRTGVGLGYMTQHFHPVDNYKNLAIGSHFNIFINLMFNYRYHLTKLTDVTAGIGLIHISNGGTASPNYGINLPVASIAVSQRISPKNRRLLPRRPSIPLFSYKDNKIFIYNVQACYANKDMGNIVGKRYNVYNGSVSVLKRLNKVHALGVSIDGVWDEYIEDFLDEKLDTVAPTASDIFRTSIAASYEIKFSHMIASLGFGWYISGLPSTDTEYYETVALKYLVYKNAYLLVNLRAYGGRAAFLGWGIGYRLEWDYGRLKLP